MNVKVPIYQRPTYTFVLREPKYMIYMYVYMYVCACVCVCGDESVNLLCSRRRKILHQPVMRVYFHVCEQCKL